MNKDKPKYRSYIKWFWGIFSLLVVSLILIFTLISFGWLGYIPSFEELENPRNDLAAVVYGDEETELGRYYRAGENRTFVSYNNLPAHLVNALIATEDIRYKEHSGIDGKSLLRVLFRTIILNNQSSGGGSTITQQLAKQLYHEPAANIFERAIQKLNEWVIAVKLEKSYTKEEIISMYLNKYDFLYNAVGIQSAARVYFNTSVDSLNLKQSAVLVGMMKNSSLYNPRRDQLQGTNLMLNRRNVVLAQMKKYNYITDQRFDSLKNLPIELDYMPASHKEFVAPYFIQYLKKIMHKTEPQRDQYTSYRNFHLDSLEWATNELYGWCNKNFKPDGENWNLYSDGLKIHTAINAEMQSYAEEAVKEHVGQDLQQAFYNEKKGKPHAPYSKELTPEEIEHELDRSIRNTQRYRAHRRSGIDVDSIQKIFNEPVPMTVFSWEGDVDTVMTPQDSVIYHKYFLRAGVMSMNPHSGHVKAYVGGPDFRRFEYDMVTLGKRQVGSTIKPFLYTLAMQEGYTPCYETVNSPVSFTLPDGTVYTPKNSGNYDDEGKVVTLKWGLANSVNYISAFLMKQFGPQQMIQMCKKLGIESYLPAVPSLALGVGDVELSEMVEAYSTYVNKGIHTDPLYVTHIEDKFGNIISTFKPRRREAINEQTAYLMVKMLQAVINKGSGIRLRYKYQFEAPIGGKTGTTQNHSDGWFMGITPELVTGVWVGGEIRSIHFDSMTQGQGANMALPVWALYMKKVYENPELGYSQETKFIPPANFNIETECENQESQKDSDRLEIFQNGDYF